jgi:hypothetical protein
MAALLMNIGTIPTIHVRAAFLHLNPTQILVADGCG